MYIPEIGDRWSLTADWTFSLHEEHRNDSVIRALGLRKLPDRLAVFKEARQLTNSRFDNLNDDPDAGHYIAANIVYYAREAVAAGLVTADRLQWLEDLAKKPWEVTLAVGTILTVDRVYIRHGAREYSSLSFYIERSPDERLNPSGGNKGFMKGRKRFWAKLGDVRLMEAIVLSSKEVA